MPKNKRIRGDKVVRGGPLADQIVGADLVKASGRTKVRKRQEDDGFVDSDLTKKILSQARLQQQELEEECGVSPSHPSSTGRSDKQYTLSSRDEDESDSQLKERLAAQEGMLGPVELDPEEEKAFELFMKKGQQHRSLAETIQSRLTEKRTEIETVMSDAPEAAHNLPPKLVTLFETVGDILKKYRGGKLPKLFKLLPKYENWEQYLSLTRPDEWTAAAMYGATRIFASNLSASLAQRFYYSVLFPRIRDDIREYKRLNFHLMLALKKALFKPSAFFKGILLPLCESGDCTLREATIISSVLREQSLPVHHAGAAIDLIASMEYSGASSIFLRTLLEKKFALPYSVVDAVVTHFVRFMSDGRELPVLWHQSLLTFVQRYKCDITQEQKEQLCELIKKHHHHEISEEVRRELENSIRRKTPMESAATK